MNKTTKCGVEDLFALFEDTLSPADILSAKLKAQISATITKERIKLHMNQTEFAKHIHAQQSQVSHWERGDYNFSIEKIADIAAKLDLDVNFTAMHMSLYKTLDGYNSNVITSPQPFSYIFKGEKAIDSNRIYNSKNLVPVKSYVKEGSNYVKLR